MKGAYMAKIKVKAVIDGGVHLKYGEIKKGATYEIEEEDFGAELFERPHPGFESPHERADRERKEAGKETVGAALAPPLSETESGAAVQGAASSAPTSEKSKKTAPASNESGKQEGGN
jgi:hypothetical protein